MEGWMFMGFIVPTVQLPSRRRFDWQVPLLTLRLSRIMHLFLTVELAYRTTKLPKSQSFLNPREEVARTLNPEQALLP